MAKSAHFCWTQIVLSALGLFLLVGIALQLIQSSATTTQVIGWSVVALLLVGTAGALRPCKKR